MIKDPVSNSLVPFDFSHLQQKVPEIERFDFDIDNTSFNPIVDSSDMNLSTWCKICTVIEENYPLYDGFVVLHGTDTMAYTASALSFMLKNLKKPVVFTGSQLPIGTIRTDGKENLITALDIASSYQNNEPLVPEVSIFFQDKLFRGNRTTKYNAEHFRAFRSDNYPPLAEVGIHIKFNHPYILDYGDGAEFSVLKKMDNNIGLLRLFPGMNETYVKTVLNTPGMKALVLETFGAGNAPTSSWFLKAIEDALKDGLVIYNVSQCLAGSVEMGVYETGRRLLELGVCSGNDITTEAAITKLMYLFGNFPDINELKDKLHTSLRGEVSIS